MIYKCKICDYECSIKSNFDKHMATDKHSNNVKLKNVKVNICEFCQNTFNSQSGLARHKNNCGTKQAMLKENISQKEEIARLTEEIVLLKNQKVAELNFYRDQLKGKNELITNLSENLRNTLKSHFEYTEKERSNVIVNGDLRVSKLFE
ncbi:MAG: zinc finger protein [Harvfovirus sp.]|uniref:Zinc finger protein n=1 Tax=Harvfovirus sp. TaxID=2487768 RepID=A0A3G5A530_9VIRU|nr:MAG: zinc finger protein [Harvfovirus sp.]